jgi:hypothetical protein
MEEPIMGEWSWPSAKSDNRFLKSLGIVEDAIEDPYFRGMPIAPETPPLTLTQKDIDLLGGMKISWFGPVEEEYVPPKSLKEYLAKHPHGIYVAVRSAAKEFGYETNESNLTAWANSIIRMFKEFEEENLEDVIEMYTTAPARRPDQTVWEHFDAYVKFRVRAALPVLTGLWEKRLSRVGNPILTPMINKSMDDNRRKSMGKRAVPKQNTAVQDRVMTPDDLALRVVRRFKSQIQGKVLEPCSGEGAFVRALRQEGFEVIALELDRGQDFFDFHERVDWIVTNPPWSGKRLRAFALHAYEVAHDIVFLCPTGKFGAFKAAIREMSEAGFEKVEEIFLAKDPPRPWPQGGFLVGAIHLKWTGRKQEYL